MKKFNNLAFKGTPLQMEVLQDALKFFKNVRVLDKYNTDITNKMKFIRGWQISINGVLHLWDILKGVGFDYLFTRRLTQDCLENTFGTIRQQTGNCVNPTPVQFQ